MRIPTIIELESKIGCRLLKTSEMSEAISVIRSKFQNFEAAGMLDGHYYILNKDYVAPKVKRKPMKLYPESKIQELKTLFESYDKRAKELNSKKELTRDHSIARTLGFTLEEFLEEIENGLWDEHIVDKMWGYKPNRIIYYLTKECVNHSKYVSLARLPEFINVHQQTVYSYVNQGLLKQPKYLEGTNKWDIEQARKDIADIKLANTEKFKTKKADHFSLLSEEQQGFINSYLKKRKKGSPIVWESKEFYGYVAGEREKDQERIRYVLSKYLVKLISSKKMEGERVIPILPSQNDDIHAFDNMDESTLESVRRKASKFDLFEMKADDIDLIMEGYKPTSEWTASETLRPFMYFLLSEWESKYPGWQIADDRNYRMDYFKTRTDLFNAVNSLMRKQPKVPKKDKREKVYLNREDIVRIYQTIRLMGKKRVPMKNWRRNAVMWMIGAFVAVRPEEMNGLRIEHFDLDENGFLRKVNSLGYGLLWIPEEISKGVYSPSHPDYGSLIVPNLVELINEYLEKEIYPYQKSRGYGYLFRARSTIANPDVMLEKPMNWLYRSKEEFDFLTQDQIKAFQFKSSRHTLNNLFEKTGLRDSDLNAAKKRAGQIQMRHDIEKTSGTIGDAYYTEEVSLENYVKCVDEILNFPWNHKDLEVWEVAKGYGNVSKRTTGLNPYEIFETAPKNVTEETKKVTLDAQIAQRALIEKETVLDDVEESRLKYEALDKEFNRYLKTSFKKLGISFQQRQQKLNEMELEIKKLQSKIS